MSPTPPFAHLQSRAPRRGPAASLLADAAGVAAAGALVVLVAALVMVVLGARGRVRAWYALTPEAPTHARFSDVFALNLRVCSMALLVASWPGARRVLDRLLGALLVVNAALVGGALGAYGPQLTRQLVGHTAVELAAASIAGATYLDACRHRRIRLGCFAGGTAATAGVLAIAALMEVNGA